jgi:hypothetical protein
VSLILYHQFRALEQNKKRYKFKADREAETIFTQWITGQEVHFYQQ